MAEAPRAAPGLRWSCSSCAACCKAGYALGPIQPATIEALESDSIREIWPAAGDGWYDIRSGPDGAPAAYLRTPGGSCVFLRDDDLCAIHAELGPERKPWFCRRFPLAPIAGPRGTVVVVRPSCHGHHKTFDTGPELDQATIEEAVRITPAESTARFEPSVVEVLPGRGVGLDDWLYLEERILQVLEAPTDPWAAVRSVRDELRRAMPAGWTESHPERSEMALQASLQAFDHVLGRVRQGHGGSPPHRRRVEAIHDAVVRARAAEPGERALTGRARDWLLLNLRTAVHGKELPSHGPIVAGLGLYLLGVDVFARASGASTVDADVYGIDWSMWHDLLAHEAVRATVKVVRSALVDRVIHL